MVKKTLTRTGAQTDVLKYPIFSNLIMKQNEKGKH